MTYDDFEINLRKIFQKRGRDLGEGKILMRYRIKDNSFVFFVKGVTYHGIFNSPFNPVRVRGDVTINTESELKVELTAYPILNIYTTTVIIGLLLFLLFLGSDGNVPGEVSLFSIIFISIAFIINRNYSLKSIKRAIQIFTVNFDNYEFIRKHKAENLT